MIIFSVFLLCTVSLALVGAKDNECSCIYKEHIVTPPEAIKYPKNVGKWGYQIFDNYYYFRNKSDERLLSYLESETKYKFVAMNHTQTLQKNLYNEFISRISEKPTLPVKYGNYYYYSYYVNGDYPVWARKYQTMQSSEQIILDVNVLFEELNATFLEIGSLSVSPDENSLAFSFDTVGSERFTIRFKNLLTGRYYPDILEDTYYAAQWFADSSTILYSKLLTLPIQPFQAYKHSMGTLQSDDVLMYDNTDPEYEVRVTKTNDERYMVVYVSSYETTEIWFMDAQTPSGTLQLLYERVYGIHYIFEHNNGFFYLLTDSNGDFNYKLVRVSHQDWDQKNWEMLIPHNPEVHLVDLRMYKELVIVIETDVVSARQRLHYYDVDPWQINGNVPLPNSEPYGIYETFPYDEFSYFDFNAPYYAFTYGSMIKSDVDYGFFFANLSLIALNTLEVPGYDKSLYQERTLYATSTDGYTIPIEIAYKTDKIVVGVASPLLLQGYGAYGSEEWPYFDANMISLMDRGFIIAYAHIRGGSIRGVQWHSRLLTKRDTFNDYIKCAEYLISQGLTSSTLLAGFGYSAGGLNVMASTMMRPDLFKVVWAHYPFVDVINTQADPSISLVSEEFSEWGNSNKLLEYQYMRSYDPYNNVIATEYPHIWLDAGMNDARVNYWEPAKLAAKLRELKTDSNTIILNSLGSGHAGSSGDDYYVDLSMQFAFLVDKILCDQEVCLEEERTKPLLEVLIPITIIVLGIIGAALFFALKRAGKFKYFRIPSTK